jgi:hypothetical protein
MATSGFPQFDIAMRIVYMFDSYLYNDINYS